jgi:fumarate hydratase class II
MTTLRIEKDILGYQAASEIAKLVLHEGLTFADALKQHTATNPTSRSSDRLSDRQFMPGPK